VERGEREEKKKIQLLKHILILQTGGRERKEGIIRNMLPPQRDAFAQKVLKGGGVDVKGKEESE